MNNFFNNERNRRGTVLYQPSLLLKAFQIYETNQDKYQNVKADWIKGKMKLERKILRYNQKHEVTTGILNLIKDRDSPSPRYKS